MNFQEYSKNRYVFITINFSVSLFYLVISALFFYAYPDQRFTYQSLFISLVSALPIAVAVFVLYLSTTKEDMAQSIFGQGLSHSFVNTQVALKQRREAIQQEAPIWTTGFFTLLTSLSNFIIIILILYFNWTLLFEVGFSLIWVLIWGYFLRNQLSSRKKIVNELKMQKYKKRPDVLVKIFDYYDFIRYSDLQQLLFLSNNSKFESWIDSLNNIPGLNKEQKGIKIDRSKIKNQIPEILKKYEEFDFD